MAAGNALPTKKYLQSKWSSSKEQSLVRLVSIIRDHNRDELEHFLKESKWNVNQMFPTDLVSFPCERHTFCQKSDQSVHNYWISAIHLVVDECWHEGLGVLIKAGADINLCDYVECVDSLYQPIQYCTSFESHACFKMSCGVVFTPLMRAMGHFLRHTNLPFVEDLLEHGADPNLRCPKTNHSAISLALAYRKQSVIDLILKKSKVDLNVMLHKEDILRRDILSLACNMIKTENTMRGYQLEVLQPRVIKDLVDHGADVNAHSYDLLSTLCSGLFQLNLEILDILFKEGIDINVIHENCTILRKAYGKGGNHVRWLIRHGAYTNLFSPERLFFYDYNETPYHDMFLLVQAGIMPEYWDIQALRRRMFKPVKDIVIRVPLPSNFDKIKMSTFKQWNRGRHLERQHQEADLQEFSDETLQAFPDSSKGFMSESEKKLYLKQILDFVSEPPLLKWRCRQLIRQTLVSHSPTAVKSLLLPSALKRYILCHEL